jgi:hypothetical protein
VPCFRSVIQNPPQRYCFFMTYARKNMRFYAFLLRFAQKNCIMYCFLSRASLTSKEGFYSHIPYQCHLLCHNSSVNAQPSGSRCLFTAIRYAIWMHLQDPRSQPLRPRQRGVLSCRDEHPEFLNFQSFDFRLSTFD